MEVVDARVEGVARVHGAEAVEDGLEDLPATGPCQGQGLAAEEDSREEDLDQGPSEGILETGTNTVLDHVKTQKYSTVVLSVLYILHNLWCGL